MGSKQGVQRCLVTLAVEQLQAVGDEKKFRKDGKNDPVI